MKTKELKNILKNAENSFKKALLKTVKPENRFSVSCMLGLYGFSENYGFSFDTSLDNLKAGFYPVKKSIVEDIEKLENDILKNGKDFQLVKEEENKYKAFLPCNLENPFYSVQGSNDTIEENIEEKEKPVYKNMGKKLDYSFMQ